MAARALTTLSARLVGTAVNFALLLVTMRLYGPEATGQLYTTIAITAVLGTLFALGLPKVFLRALATPGATQAPLHAVALWLVTLGAALSIALAAAALLVAPSLAHPLLLTAAGVGQAALLLRADLCKARQHPELALFLELSAVPLLTLAALALPALAPRGPAALYALASVVAAALAALPRARLHPGPALPVLRPHLKAEGRAKILAYWTTSLATIGYARLHGLVAPFVLDPAAIGVLAILSGIAGLLATIAQAVGAYAAPHLARACARSPAAARHLYWQIARLQSALALPLALGLWLGAAPLLALFGPAALAAQTPLAILIAAQSLRIVLGNSETFLLMAGRPRAELVSIGLSVMVFAAVLANVPPSLLHYCLATAALICTRALCSLAASAQVFWTRPIPARASA